jgi:hypothetical protein
MEDDFYDKSCDSNLLWFRLLARRTAQDAAVRLLYASGSVTLHTRKSRRKQGIPIILKKIEKICFWVLTKIDFVV